MSERREFLDLGKLVGVPVKSGAQSVTNWTQIVGIAAMVASFYGLDIPPEAQAAVAVGIQGVVAAITVIRRTYFTASVTPAVAKKLPVAR
jgi:hypothetical protein